MERQELYSALTIRWWSPPSLLGQLMTLLLCTSSAVSSFWKPTLTSNMQSVICWDQTTRRQTCCRGTFPRPQYHNPHPLRISGSSWLIALYVERLVTGSSSSSWKLLCPGTGSQDKECLCIGPEAVLCHLISIPPLPLSETSLCLFAACLAHR